MSEPRIERAEKTIARPILAGALLLSLLMLAAGALAGRHVSGVAFSTIGGDARRQADEHRQSDARTEAQQAAVRIDAVLRRGERSARALAHAATGALRRAADPADLTANSTDTGAKDRNELQPLGTDAAWFAGPRSEGYAVLRAAGEEITPGRVERLANALAVLEPTLAALLDGDGGVAHISVALPGLGIVGAPAPRPDVHTDDALLSSWFDALLDDPVLQSSWTGAVRSPLHNASVVRFLHPLPDGKGGVLVVAAADVDTSAVDVALAAGSASPVVLLSLDGSVLATSPGGTRALGLDPETTRSPEALTTAFAPFLSGSEFLRVPAAGTTVELTERTATLRPLQTAPWSVAALHSRAAIGVPRRSATGGLAKAATGLGTLVFGLLAFAALAVFASGWMLTRRLTSRLEGVTTGAAMHSAGDLSHRIPVDGDDELGQIAQNLNSTAARLQRTIGRLEEGERRLQSLIDNMGEGLLICDAEDRIVFANVAFTEMLEMRLEMLQNTYVEELVLPDSLRRYRRESGLRGGGKPTRYELGWFCQKGDHVRTLVAGMPLYDQSGAYSGSYGVITDITKRDHVQAHTAQEEKLRALSEMAGAVAHDFNNHFTAIVGNAQFLLLDQHPPAVREALEIIEKSALDSTEMVRRMREFTKPRSLEVGASITNPNTVLTKALEAARLRFAAIARQQEITYRVVCETAAHRPIRCHPSELEEAIRNIVENALEAMPNGGQVELAVFDRGEDAVAFRIADEGCGIDLEHERKIFDPFFTTKIGEDRRSTGLGLSISYGIVKAHGGRIDLRSAPGQGTTITVVLPAYIPANQRVAGSNPADTQDEPPPRPRALVVGPKSRRTTSLHKQLQALGMYTACVTTPESALTTLEDPAIFNTLFVEYELDGANGWEFARKARGRRADLQIVLLSDPHDGLDETQARNAGIDRLLVRPFDARDLESEAIKGLVLRSNAQERATPAPEDLEAMTALLEAHADEAVLEVWSAEGTHVVDTSASRSIEFSMEELDIDTLAAAEVEVWFEIDATESSDDAPAADPQDLASAATDPSDTPRTRPPS